MKQAPSFPKYAKDWLTGQATRLMTPEQRGAFDWLLCHAWLSNPPCSLPDDATALARLSELGKRWAKVGAAIRAQFEDYPQFPGLIRNPKQFSIWSEMQEHREKRSDAGRKGNATRWPDDRKAIAKVSPAFASAVASASASPEEEPPPVSERGGSGGNGHRRNDFPLWTRRALQYKTDKIADWLKLAKHNGMGPGEDDFDVAFESAFQMKWAFWNTMRDKHQEFYIGAEA